MAANVFYPPDPSCADAKKGLITSGNIDVQTNKKDWFERVVVEATKKQPDCKTYIFSSEVVFWYMDPFFSGFEKYKDQLDFEIVLCVRDPFGMLVSMYQQFIKLGGYTIGFDQFLEQHDFMELHAIHSVALLRRFAELQIKVNLLNYTAIGRNICSRVLEVMNVDDVASGYTCEGGTVNRSLDAAELQLVLLVTSTFGRAAGTKVSCALVNQLPELRAGTLAYHPEVVAKIKKKMQPFVDELNLCLSKDEQLSLEPSVCQSDVPQLHLLNGDQVAVACTELLNHFKEVLTDPKGPAERQLICNSDGLTPLTCLVLFFLLDSATHSGIPIDKKTLAIIAEECQVSSCRSGLCESFDHNQFIGYFDYFATGDPALSSQYILISQKLNALAHAGLSPSSVLDFFAVVHRVKLRVAIG